MAGKTGGAKAEEVVFNADDTAVIKDAKDLEGLSPERKDQYLKRMRREAEALKEHYRVVDEWMEVVGHKVLIKIKKLTGSVYTQYWFNSRRYEAEYQRLLKEGGRQFENEKGVTRFVALRTVNNKPYKKKEA